MDGWMNRQEIAPFYRTLSPIGAAALLPSKKTEKELMARAREPLTKGKGTTDQLMPLVDWLKGYLTLISYLFYVK